VRNPSQTEVITSIGTISSAATNQGSYKRTDYFVDQENIGELYSKMSMLTEKEETLLQKARQIGDEFRYEPEQVAKGVLEYLKLMGMYTSDARPSVIVQ